MMSDLANNLLDAIAAGNQEQMQSAFSAAMNNKINDSLQARKIELAQQIYASATQVSDSNDDANDTDQNTDTVASDNGSEEV